MPRANTYEFVIRLPFALADLLVRLNAPSMRQAKYYMRRHYGAFTLKQQARIR